MSYSVKNTRGSLVTTINDVTVNTATPLNLIGRGVSGYGEAIANDFYHMLENWANNVPPPTPSQGMLWYDTTTGSETMRLFDGSTWSRIASGQNSSAVMLDMLAGSQNINFSTPGSTTIYTGITGKRSFVLGILVVPRGGASVTNTNPPPTFQLEVAAGTSDVMDKVAVKNMLNSNSFAYFSNEGVNRIVQAGDSLKLVVDTPVTGGDVLAADCYLFGHVRV